MPKYNPNSRFSDCWSSVGNITFYHRGGVCYYKNRPACKFRGTPAQMKTAETHRRALAAWKTLDHDTQLQWNGYAKEVRPHRPPFDGSGHITGHNLFVSAYHGFAQLGNEHIPQPRKYEPFPLFSMDFTGCTANGDGQQHLRFRLNLCGTDAPERYRVLGKFQLGEPGCGRNPGLMRNCLSESVPSGGHSVVEFTVTDTQPALKTRQMHIRYLLIDTRTGYRSLHHSLSGLF